VSTPVLIHADSLRDPDMFVATGVSVVAPSPHLETDGHKLIVVSVLEADVVRRDSRADEVWDAEQFGHRELVVQGWAYHDAEMEVVRRALERAGVAEAIVPPSFPVAIADYLRGKGLTITPDRGAFELRRRIKGAREIEAMRRAQRGTEAAFRAVRELLGSASPGDGSLVAGGEAVTCERVRDTITVTLRAHGCEGAPPLVGAGPRGALVHDLGSGPIQPGEPVIVDIFPQETASRYCADMTRTFCWGEAPERLRVMHATILEALKRSTDAIAPGVAGELPWSVACDVIEGAGFRTQRGLADGESLAEDFFHGLGHGVGVEVHEAPYMGQGITEPLREGDVVTVEPGVYQRDFGGVRLEDLVVVTGHGPEVLTDFDYDLEVRP
jgi:Xaa-Pro aminopeptidase